METKGAEFFHYLNKRYYIKEKLFFDKNGDKHVWGESIINYACKIFSYDSDFCLKLLKKWIRKYKLVGDEFRTAMFPKTLRTTWNPDIAQGLTVQFGISDSEEHLKNILIDSLGRELKADILLENKGKIKTIDEVFSLIKCLGYEPNPTHYYNLDNNTTRQYFVSTTYNEMINERQNNTLWQDWI
jgi:hypothetical protein